MTHCPWNCIMLPFLHSQPPQIPKQHSSLLPSSQAAQEHKLEAIQGIPFSFTVAPSRCWLLQILHLQLIQVHATPLLPHWLHVSALHYLLPGEKYRSSILGVQRGLLILTWIIHLSVLNSTGKKTMNGPQSMKNSSKGYWKTKINVVSQIEAIVIERI